MTTIAYKDGILAADTCVTDNGAICGTATKLARAPNGAIAGASGNLAPCAKFLSWFARDFGMVEKVAKIEGNSAALIIDKDGTVHTLDAGYPAFIINAPFHAIGSGSRIALGAMAAGASAEEAVRIACGIDDGTREPVETLRLNERKLTEDEKAAFDDRMAEIATRTAQWAKRTPRAGGPGGGGCIEVPLLVGDPQVRKCAPGRVECFGGGGGHTTITNHTPPVPIEEGIKVWSTREEEKTEFGKLVLQNIRATWIDAARVLDRGDESGKLVAFHWSIGDRAEAMPVTFTPRFRHDFHGVPTWGIEAVCAGMRFFFAEANPHNDDLGIATSPRLNKPAVNRFGETPADVAEREKAIERMVEKKQREKGDHAADAMRWAMMLKPRPRSWWSRFKSWIGL